ncbi:hypothetical protein BC828DRAFT_383423, partial [Blastocladiella britannica]
WKLGCSVWGKIHNYFVERFLYPRTRLLALLYGTNCTFGGSSPRSALVENHAATGCLTSGVDGRVAAESRSRAVVIAASSTLAIRVPEREARCSTLALSFASASDTDARLVCVMPAKRRASSSATDGATSSTAGRLWRLAAAAAAAALAAAATRATSVPLRTAASADVALSRAAGAMAVAVVVGVAARSSCRLMRLRMEFQPLAKRSVKDEEPGCAA